MMGMGGYRVARKLHTLLCSYLISVLRFLYPAVRANFIEHGLTYTGNTVPVEKRPYRTMIEIHARIVFENADHMPRIEVTSHRWGGRVTLSIADIVNVASKVKTEMRQYERVQSYIDETSKPD
jgi:hypothetical protein